MANQRRFSPALALLTSCFLVVSGLAAADPDLDQKMRNPDSGTGRGRGLQGSGALHHSRRLVVRICVAGQLDAHRDARGKSRQLSVLPKRCWGRGCPG
jgi:hypothetical protein